MRASGRQLTAVTTVDHGAHFGLPWRQALATLAEVADELVIGLPGDDQAAADAVAAFVDGGLPPRCTRVNLVRLAQRVTLLDMEAGRDPRVDDVDDLLRLATGDAVLLAGTDELWAPTLLAELRSRADDGVDRAITVPVVHLRVDPSLELADPPYREARRLAPAGHATAAVGTRGVELAGGRSTPATSGAVFDVSGLGDPLHVAARILVTAVERHHFDERWTRMADRAARVLAGELPAAQISGALGSVEPYDGRFEPPAALTAWLAEVATVVGCDPRLRAEAMVAATRAQAQRLVDKVRLVDEQFASLGSPESLGALVASRRSA